MELETRLLELRYARLRIADPARQGRLIESLQQHGQQLPVVVVPLGDGLRYVLIDGYARVAALRSLAQDVVAGVVLEMSEAEALVLSQGLDHGRRRTALEEGWLLTALVERHGLEQRVLARRLQRSASWVCRRLALVQVLPEAVQDAVRAGRVPPSGAMKSLVPLARANAEACATLVRALSPQAISARELERLCLGYHQADAEGRARILGNPWLFLRAAEALSRAPKLPPGDPAEALLRDLETVGGLSRRARRRLRDGVLREVGEASRRAIEHGFEQAQQGFAALSEALTDEVDRARSGHPQCDPEAA